VIHATPHWIGALPAVLVAGTALQVGPWELRLAR
jgi:hypothetical protein